MSNLRQFIERVLVLRRAQKPRLEAVQQALNDFMPLLAELRQLATEISAGEDAPPDLRQRAMSLHTGAGNVETQLNEAIARTANLLARFGKNTINIGVAGKTGMGKSTFLQAISGLDDVVIPTSPGKPCTGAKSKVLHCESEPHAVIEFFKDTEFLQGVVHAYFSELGLAPLPTTLTAFARFLPAKPDGLSPGFHAVYAQLEKLHGLLPQYRNLLSRPPERIRLDEVRPYVSQDDGRYLAVNCASIYVKFPHGDVTGLGLIDLPGLGEVAKGHAQKLIQSLQQDVDAVIVLKRPLSGAVYDTEDHKVFDVVKQTVPELELSDWLFLVLNRDSQNSEQVEILKNNPPQIGTLPRLIVADCRDRVEVDRVFLDVLRHLEQNLERIDQRQISALANHLSNLAHETVSLIQPMGDYFQKDSVGIGDFQKFGELFRSFRKQLRANLDDLTDEYRQLLRTNGMAKEFASAVDDACNAAKADICMPSPEELKLRRNDLGGWPAVVQEELHHLRAYLTHRLADILDDRLAQIIDEAKHKIMTRLMTDSLGRILAQDLQKEADPHRQLLEFRQLLNSTAALCPCNGGPYQLQ